MLLSAFHVYYSKGSIDSIKQHLMMRHEGEWNAASITEHYDEMQDVLLKSLEDSPNCPDPTAE